ncbi:acyl-CoA carboxylase subunit beta [Bacillus sp. FSL W7-1360]
MDNHFKNKLLHKKNEELLQGGGQARQQKQRASGKALARARIDALVDKDSFTECLRFATGEAAILGDGVIIGYATIMGRLVCLYAQDFTVCGGTVGKKHAEKIVTILEMAVKLKAPLIGLIDSGGARIQEGVEALHGYGQIFRKQVQYSGVIPQLSVILGPCAGGAVYSPALTDVIFMVEKISHMFVTGPKVLAAVTGSDVDMESLGGARMHATQSGNVHVTAKSEAALFKEVRAFLSYMPTGKEIPCHKHMDKVASLAHVLPINEMSVYDVREVIQLLADRQSFMELSSCFARNLVTGLIRLNEQTVGVVANNPKHLAGGIDVDASDKCARFVRFCDCYRIPLLVLEDVCGFIPGTEQEQRGLIRHGAKVIYAFAEATVPKITVILRKAYGGAFVALNSKALGADFVFSWPTAEMAVMGADGAKSVINTESAETEDTPVPTAFLAAEKGIIDDIIEPETTRARLIDAYAVLACKKIAAYPHGNMPL